LCALEQLSANCRLKQGRWVYDGGGLSLQVVAKHPGSIDLVVWRLPVQAMTSSPGTGESVITA
jgi:hypothetical protein